MSSIEDKKPTDDQHVADENQGQLQYFTEIEEHFCRRRGSPLLLSPSDYQLVQKWQRAGIPKEIITAGIDRYFAKRRKAKRVVSISYCEEDIQAIWQSSRDGSINAEDLGAASAPFDKERFFNRLREEFTASTERARTEGAYWLVDLLADLQEQADTLEGVSMPEEEIEKALREMDRILMEQLMDREGSRALSALRIRAREELDPYRADMDEAVFEKLITRRVKQILRERHRLPHLSLISL